MKILSLVFLSITLMSTMTFGQSDKEIGKTVEKLRMAMIEGNKESLTKLTSDDLTYGHSSGAIESKTEFIDKIVTGKSDFVTIELTEQFIKVTGGVATVRHNFKATTNNNGVAGDVNLHILTVWIKQKDEWKLLARQAVKLAQ